MFTNLIHKDQREEGLPSCPALCKSLLPGSREQRSLEVWVLSLGSVQLGQKDWLSHPLGL